MEHITGDVGRIGDVCVAFGAFDGFHLGHRACLDLLLSVSKTSGVPAAILSFDQDNVTGDDKILSTEAEKAYYLKGTGLDILVSLPQDLWRLPTAQFVEDVLVGRFGASGGGVEFGGAAAGGDGAVAVGAVGGSASDVNAAPGGFVAHGIHAVVAGEDSPYLPALQDAADRGAFSLHVCKTVRAGGEPITSNRVIQAIESDDMPTAIAMLGHPYLIQGEVVYGKQLGRTVGLPTANISFISNKLLPADGIYGTISDMDGKRMRGIANIGLRPTVDNFAYRTVENFIFDFDGDIYGKTVSLENYLKVRGVRKFKDLAEVKLQVNLDSEVVVAHFDKEGIS
ncbi:MAG: hypothetical protein LBR77_01445 [Lachnospiraceae bacterium]|jgi:riboflavin kinase/FMN adenylyltransferase|nr:hypothetical protein [Lachnospiraceae bacterium]